MPVAPNEDNPEPEPRTADIQLMRLPDFRTDWSKAPYIIHQAVTGRDIQPPGERVHSETVIRSTFCVYNSDASEGGLMLLNLMERLRIALLRDVVIGQRYQLKLSDGLETLIYSAADGETLAPYYLGDMLSVWIIPAAERQVRVSG